MFAYVIHTIPQTSRSFEIQYAAQLKVTFAINMHSHSCWFGRSSLNSKDLKALSRQPKDPLNCLPWSNICQCTAGPIKNRPILLTKWSSIPFGGTEELKWICESSLFEELGRCVSQTLKLVLHPFTCLQGWGVMCFLPQHNYNNEFPTLSHYTALENILTLLQCQ